MLYEHLKMNPFIDYIVMLSLSVIASMPSNAQGQVRKQAPIQSNDSTYSHEWGNVVVLDGEWEIAEGSKQQVPTQFLSKIPVPGLVTSAKPGFKGVGEESNLREAYWYRKKFKVQGNLPALARLKIFKSMFGTRVFLTEKQSVRVNLILHRFTSILLRF
jgi:hypothetical protein